VRTANGTRTTHRTRRYDNERNGRRTRAHVSVANTSTTTGHRKRRSSYLVFFVARNRRHRRSAISERSRHRRTRIRPQREIRKRESRDRHRRPWSPWSSRTNAISDNERIARARAHKQNVLSFDNDIYHGVDKTQTKQRRYHVRGRIKQSPRAFIYGGKTKTLFFSHHVSVYWNHAHGPRTCLVCGVRDLLSVGQIVEFIERLAAIQTFS